MLSKCANPACSNTLRYIHEGKLYVMESKCGLATAMSEGELPGKFRTIEYAWLCSSCCQDLTVHIDHEGKIRVVRRPDSGWTRSGNF